MFEYDPRKRISARDALEHPYFADLEESVRSEALETLPPRQSSPEMDFGYFLSSIETSTYPLKSFIGPQTRQPELTAGHRRMLVDWLIEVVDVYTMSPRSAFIAVGLVDRTLSLYPRAFPRAEFQLLGATCLHIASKCEDVSYIGVEDLASCGDNIYTVKNVLEMEECVLRLLNFKLIVPTILDFLNLMLVELGRDEREMSATFRIRQGIETSNQIFSNRLSDWAHYLAELALQEYKPFALREPSRVAAAILLYSRYLEGLRDKELWPNGAERFCNYTKNDLHELVNRLHEIHVGARALSLEAVNRRYSQSDRSSVSTLSAPRNLTEMSWRSS